MPAIGEILQAAIREGGFTAKNVPSVAVHLAGPVRSSAALAPEAIKLSGGLMREIEGFLSNAGIPMKDGLRVLKADAAADAVVLTAKGLENTDKHVIIKISREKGIFTHHPHLNEEWVSEGVQKVFPSALNNGETVMVRIEPPLVPVNKMIASLPPEMQQKATQQFNEAMYAKAKGKGLIARDVKPNNFGIPVSAGPVTSVEEMIAQAKVMDLDAVSIPTAQARAQMANPGVEYKAQSHTAPATHIDHILDKAPAESKWVDRQATVAKVQEKAAAEKPAEPQSLGDKYAALRERMERLGIKSSDGTAPGGVPGRR